MAVNNIVDFIYLHSTHTACRGGEGHVDKEQVKQAWYGYCQRRYYEQEEEGDTRTATESCCTTGVVNHMSDLADRRHVMAAQACSCLLNAPATS